MSTWTDKDIEIVETFINIKKRGLYASGEQVTIVYNRVLGKNLRTTNCGSCIRSRITELETELERFKKRMELENKAPEDNKSNEADNEPQDQKEAVTIEIKEEISNVDKQSTPATKTTRKASRKKGSK